MRPTTSLDSFDAKVMVVGVTSSETARNGENGMSSSLSDVMNALLKAPRAPNLMPR